MPKAHPSKRASNAIRRLATHAALLLEAKAALAGTKLEDGTIPPLMTHSVRRALAHPLGRK